MAPFFDALIHLDFETYYDSQYSLSKMPTLQYVRDPRFKCLGVAVYLEGVTPTDVYMTEEEFLTWWWSYPAGRYAKVATSAFNNGFDSCILTQRYRIFPRFYVCTSAMSRALLPISRQNLKTVVKALGIGEKGDALTPGSYEVTKELTAYACNDNALSRQIYTLLSPLFSDKETRLIDWTVRAAVEPKLELSIPVLHQVRNEAIAARDEAIASSGMSEAVLASNTKFADVVRGLGLETPRKISKTTGLEADAFAKGDDEFVAFMLENPEHAAIWEGRLAAKSLINIRRPEKLLGVVDTSVKNGFKPTIGMPLLYCGAHTGRWSGCLVAETEVVVYNKFNGVETKNITDVLLDDLVWDGEEFVEHDGVVFKGYREVITHDGVTGTGDHIVFTDSGETSLLSAMRRGEAIKDAGVPSDNAVDTVVRAYP